MSIRLSVIIPAYGRPETLRLAVASAVDQDLDPSVYEVVVVDSSPDERNRAVVEEIAAGARCRVRCLRKNPEGPGPSRNLGARESEGEFLAFFDSDCVASRGWLRGGLEAFAADARIGIAQGRTLPPPGVKTGIFSRYIVVDRENFVYETCNIFYRRAAFEETPGFWVDRTPTSGFVTGGEDVTLAWQVKRRGWLSVFAPDALAYHEVTPMKPWQWLYEKRLPIWPKVVKAVPEIRSCFPGRIFYDRAQVGVTLALASLALAFAHPAALLGVLPYAWIRGSEPTRSLRGPLRLLRVGFYFPRDVISFVLLLRGSIRHRCLLL